MHVALLCSGRKKKRINTSRSTDGRILCFYCRKDTVDSFLKSGRPQRNHEYKFARVCDHRTQREHLFRHCGIRRQQRKGLWIRWMQNGCSFGVSCIVEILTQLIYEWISFKRWRHTICACERCRIRAEIEVISAYEGVIRAPNSTQPVGRSYHCWRKI